MVNYYLGENKYQEGIDYLDQMIAQNPDNVEYHRVKASVLVQVGKYDEAREILNECVKREPDNGENYYYIGRAWAEQGEKRRQYADDNWNKLSNKEFNAINEEADKCYHNALQAYENAHDKMNSQTAVYKDLVQNLYIIYFRINDKQNAEKYKAELDSFK